MNELKDNTTFENIPNLEETAHRCKNDITNWLELYHEEPGMTLKIAKWVYPTEDCVPGYNYINLKAHKPNKNYPGGLISASCNGYTNNLASLTVHELRKVNLPYNLKDTNHFLQKVDNINKSGIFLSINDNIFMLSFDIEAMFPSITKEHGLHACKQHLNTGIPKGTHCVSSKI